jgi:WD40 repeat protein
VWDTGTGEQVGQLAGHEALVNVVAFSPGGKHVASGSGVPAPGRLTPFDHASSAPGTDNSLRIWDVGRQAKVHQINFPAPVSALSFSTGGKLVIAASGNTVQMIEVASGGPVTAPPSGERFVAGLSTADRKVSLRHAIGSSVLIESQSGQEVRKLDGPIDGLPLHHAFSQDGSRVVLGTGKAELFKRNPEAPGSVYVFEVSSGKRLAHLSGHRREVTLVAITADGRYAFSRDGEKRLLLWELPR